MDPTPVAPLDFEDEVHEIELRLAAVLQDTREGSATGLLDKAKQLAADRDKLLKQLYGKLDAWQTCQVARHPERPQASDYIERVLSDFVELHGDRMWGDDPAIIGGLAQLGGRSVMALGQQKGRGTEGRIAHNFGMPKPEGYRKALRLMRLAAKFRLPIVTFIDTPGAYPGIDAEERGQSQAIGSCLFEMATLETPIVSVVVGEGGSGGALALGVADEVMMLQHAVYSVISPEGCASILWRSGEHAEQAAGALRLTARDLHKLGVIDTIVAEPPGGAHRDYEAATANVRAALEEVLDRLSASDLRRIVSGRARRARAFGSYGGR